MDLTPEQRAAAALLGVFVLHNLEEVWHLPQDVRDVEEVTGLELPWLTQPVFGAATAALTGLVAWGLRDGLTERGPAGEAYTVAAASALIGNAATHGLRALALRRYNGGLATAPLMALLARRVLDTRRGQLSRGQRRAVALGANVSAIPLILAALTSARALSRSRRARRG